MAFARGGRTNEKIHNFLISIVAIFIVICSLALLNILLIASNKADEERRKAERAEKQILKQCVLDVNYRKDCKYLIYEDYKKSSRGNDDIFLQVFAGSFLGTTLGR